MTSRPTVEETRLPQDEDFRRPGISFALWFAMLGGPFAALADGVVLYVTITRACQAENVWTLHLICAITLIVAFAALLTAYRLWRTTGAGEATNKYGVMHRGKFMAVVGLMSASLGILGILMEWYPIFVLGPCNGA